jgi:spermidine/putrescine-binding protein
MKRFALLFLIAAAALAVVSCTQKQRLYVLNWGDYMDPELIAAFEDEYDVRVSYKPAGSNEEMATLLRSGNQAYDIVVPSDYMIDKLIQEDMLQPIDWTKLTHWSEQTVIDKLADLIETMPFADYAVPYAWGTIGILYNTNAAGLTSYLEAEGWGALFEGGTTYRTGMYDSPRDAVAAALLYTGHDVNSDVESELAEAESALKNAGFDAWGEDNLKGLVISGNLDMALVYSGDYFSEYYIAQDDGLPIEFDYYVPEATNVWMDAMVIPKNALNVELAHQFIDFFLDYDNAVQNADYIGYAPCFQEVYDVLLTPDYGYDFPTFDPYPLGSTRQMYLYGSDDRQARITAILERAKAGN